MSATQRSVIVVGSGLAGVVAAWRLARQGHQVVLLGRAARAGGRMVAERREGFVLDAFPTSMTAGDARLHAFVADVGMRDDLFPLRPLETRIAYLGSLRDANVLSLKDVRNLPAVGLRHALRLVRLPRLMRRYASKIDLERPEFAADLDDRSLRDFGTLYFGRSVFEGWMAPTAAGDSLGDLREMSRVQFLLQLRRHGSFRPGLPRGSIADVIERATSQLNVRGGVEVCEVALRKEGGARVVLGDGRQVGADAVVLAVQAHEALRIAAPALVPAERDGLAAVRYAQSIGLAAALCRAPGLRPVRMLVPDAEGSPIASATLEAGLRESRAPEGLGLALIRSTPGFAKTHMEAPTETVEKELLDAIDSFHPGLQRAVEFTRVTRSERAAPRFDVGRYREIARFQRVQEDRRAAGRRLYFAGDYLCDPSLEGAVVSAERAVAAVCQDLA